MAQPRVQAFIKKNGAKKQTLQLSTYLVESNMLLQHIIKGRVWFTFREIFFERILHACALNEVYL